MSATVELVRPPEPPSAVSPVHARSRFGLLLGVILLVGAILRLVVLFSPLGELDADEAVVGLMARHIAFLGERPLVYYGQEYLGSLEAFTAAPLFALFGSSALVLKLVPAAYSLGFLWLSALVARRLFGDGPALATAAYLALPPSMWAVWSTKARGGYAEVLFLGEALLLATLWLAERSRAVWGTLLWGILAGAAFWTHPLAIVYIAPAALYLFARRRAAWTRAELTLGVAGVLLGVLPLLVYNLDSGFKTITALTKPADLPWDPREQFFRFFRVGVPVLLGLGQPTTSIDMFDRDWLLRPASRVPVVMALYLLIGAAFALQAGAVRRLFGRRPGGASSAAALLVLVAAVVPPIMAMTRFGFFVSEPRYAMPLYSTLPLLAYGLWRLPVPVRAAGLAGVLALNVWSLATTDLKLWQPEESIASTTATRAELVTYLEAQNRHQVYTDYWIAYPLMFETDERFKAYVVSSGFNRYIPPADNVQRTPNPVWVHMPGSYGEQEFLSQLTQVGGTAREEAVSVYHVYLNVQPLEAMRPPP